MKLYESVLTNLSEAGLKGFEDQLIKHVNDLRREAGSEDLEEADSKGHKMNMIKYKADGYVDTSNHDGFSQYKGEDLVNYKEKDFKKGTSVLMPFVCGECGKEYYIKSNIHDFFKQGDFDDPYAIPRTDAGWGCPECGNEDNQLYNGSPLIKEPGNKNKDLDESEDSQEPVDIGSKFKRYVSVQFSGLFNMIVNADQAMDMAELTKDEYFYIIDHYKELKEQYPDEYESGKSIGSEMAKDLYGE